MISARLLTASCALTAALAATTVPAHAAPLADPFASVNVSCSSGSAQAAPLTADHPRVVARISNSIAGASWDSNASSTALSYSGDQLFSPSTGSLATNVSPSGVIGYCYSSSVGGAQISFYDVPTAPTNYPQSVQDPRSDPESLPFVVPSSARFVADIQLTQGAVNVKGTRLASSSTVALGVLTSGDRSLSVDALDGPPARYTVAVRPLAVAVSSLQVPAAMRAGAPETLSYDTDGSTTATVTLADATGAVRKTIASYAVESGSHTVTFDGRGDGGQLLPDGTYIATVASRDPYGTSTQQSGSVGIDGTAPQIAITPPASTSDPIQVSATDPSGVSSLSAGTPGSFDNESGSSFASTNPVTQTTSVRAPYDGWTPGSTVQIDVSAEDSLGNTAAKATRAVLIPGGKRASAPTVSKPAHPLSTTPSRQKRSTVARQGLRVSGRGAGRVRISVRVSRAVAKRLRSRSTTLATKTVTTSAGRFSARLKFSRKVRSAIGRRSRTSVKVSVSRGATASKTIAIVK